VSTKKVIKQRLLKHDSGLVSIIPYVKVHRPIEGFHCLFVHGLGYAVPFHEKKLQRLVRLFAGHGVRVRRNHRQRVAAHGTRGASVGDPIVQTRPMERVIALQQVDDASVGIAARVETDRTRVQHVFVATRCVALAVHQVIFLAVHEPFETTRMLWLVVIFRIHVRATTHEYPPQNPTSLKVFP
tara:strand:- start:3658 stop:4209 length:552 start_codon:yes stop_codon:yes gene_type:complete